MTEQMKPRYSIILPVRNGGEYLKLCVNSILSQTIPGFNLIVLDSGSTDGSLAYIQSLPDERIVIYPSPVPLTIEENWGRITAIDKNEFITLIGHDDILFSGYLAEMEMLIQAYPEASLYQAHFTYIDADGKLIRKCKPMTELEDGPSFLKACLRFEFDLMGTGFMMRSADFDRIGGMPLYPNLLFSDFELWTELTAISVKATSLKECFSFRLHQSTTKTTSDLKFHQAFEQNIYFLASLKQRSIQFYEVIQNYSNAYLLFYCRALSHRLLRTPRYKREGLSVKILLQRCKTYADLLISNHKFNPTANPGIFIAKVLDSNAIGRSMFLIFKKIYKKALLK